MIVIVVIAILAAITIVSFNGIQQRANNTKTVTAAKEGLKLLQAFKAINGEYPSGSYMYACIGEYPDDVCQEFTTGVDEVNEQTEFKTSIATVGTMPQPHVKMAGVGSGRVASGVFYRVAAQQIVYYLEGEGQACLGGNAPVNYTGRTHCTVDLP